jgi:outer membrane receptor protein involved in Fe transport
VLGHLTLDDAFEPFFEAKYVRTDSLRFGQPAFFQGQTLGGDPREQPRFDNPFLSDSARSVLNAVRVAGGLPPLTATDSFPLRRNLLDLGPRQEAATRETIRFVLGADGKFANDWNYDVSVNYGQFTEDTQVLGNLNRQRFLLAMDSTRDASGNIVCRSQVDPAAAISYAHTLDPTGTNPAGAAFANALLGRDVAACVPLNPFGQGNLTPAMRSYLLQDTTSQAKISQFVASASVSGNTHRWFELPGGPIGVALGVEHRTERNFFASDDLVANGLTFYNALPLLDPPPFKVNEVFTEFRIPLLSGMTLARDLTINAAGRYADYNGSTGGVFAHNYGVEWAPIDSLRFRVGKARAVRAPNLTELYTQQTQNFATVGDPCSARNVGTGSATRAANCAAAGAPAGYDYVYNASLQLVSGGNPALQAETSDSLTAGFVFRPEFVPGLSISVDYFHITVDNVITAPAAQDILNACYDAADLNNQFCGLFKRAGSGGGPRGEEPFRVLEGSLVQKQLNYAKSVTSGVDVEASFTHDIGVGQLSSQLVYTHTLRRDDFQNPANPNLPDQVLTELGDPRDAFNLNTDFKRGALTLGYELRFIGRMVVDRAEDFFSVGGQPPQNLDWADRRYYPTVIYHDVRASYDFGAALNVYVGVNNLTDKQPPLGLAGTGAAAGNNVGNSGIYDARGRFFFVGAKYNVGASFKH